jgi:hypothetical protein
MFFTVPPRSSALIITKQQIAPSRSKATMANLSPEPKPAFFLRSLGKTICPLASRVTTASILQHSLLSDILNQTYQINLNIYTFLKNLKKMKILKPIKTPKNSSLKYKNSMFSKNTKLSLAELYSNPNPKKLQSKS